MRLLLLVAMLYAPCSLFNVFAQIKIGGNIYGGGNAGDMSGNTSVTVRAGDIHGGVYGGARQANVGGHAFVNIDGAHMSDDIVINYVYGGNDIAGKVGEFINETDPIPAGLTDAVANGITPAEGETNAGNNTKKYGAFVLTTKERTAGTGETQRHIFIGQLFGGGNGDYTYSTTADDDGNYTASDANGPIAYSKVALIKPELSKTYLELRGGTIAYAYGGGNNATVTVATDICVKNSSSVTTDDHLKTILNINDAGLKERMKEMGLNTVSTQVSSDAFQFARVFGGNNKAEMAIRPTWHLESGAIRNLYSGGNQGAMTHKEGLLLEIFANSSIKVDNVFGGCRMAAVRPLVSGTLASGNYVESTPSEIQLHDANGNQLYNFPDGLSARVLVRGGDINNVYGGNDISGNVTGGNAIGIYTSVRGDVYGGGNGSYAYTDNDDLKESDEYRDFYYDPSTASSSVDALNAFRPNAQSVSIRVLGTADKTTVIGGAIYCGGNSATLRNDNANQDAASELKIGSYVIADKVFLGNNGANMVTEDILKQYAGSVTVNNQSYDFSQMDLASTDKDAKGETQFDKYMDGVAMAIKPRVVFDADYKPYSTMFGSFYCGGNVGSMKIDGALEVSFNDKVVIFDKVVGGSNEANVYQSAYNAQYLGGLLGDPAPVPAGSPEGTIGNKLILNFGGLKIQPKRWKIKRNADFTPDLDSDGNEQYILDGDGNRQLEWNTVDNRKYNATTKKYTPMASIAKGGSTTYDPNNDPYRRFYGGNIYGGCYSNGHVNGNVVINLNASLVDRKGDNSIFDEVEENEGEAKLYDGNYNIKYRYTGVLVGEQGMDPLGRALNVFGGGYGGDSEIWGSATINLNAGYTFQIFGGGEQGAIGQSISHEPDPNDPTKHNLEYEYDENYSTYINLKDQNNHPGTYRGDKDDRVDGVVDYDDMAEAEFIYGGSFEGLIAGSTHINLGNGRIFNTFAGSCNADILGHTETYVGRNSNSDSDLGFPWIRDHIYGGNDLGGRILGQKDFSDRVSSDIVGKVYNPKMLKASAYTEYIQGRVEHIFGGCFGDYDYRDPHYEAYAYTTGSAGQTAANLGTMRSDYHKPWMDNAFVNFKPNNTTRNAVTRIYGAGQGHAYLHASDAERDMMQDRSYILIDAPQSLTNFTAMEVFGAGDYSGVGMRNEAATTRTSGETTIEIVPALNPTIAQTNDDGVTASTVIDLIRGHLKAVYGGSFKEGTTRRTQVNVPAGSTIHVNSLFGGAYGRIDKETVNSVTTETPRIDLACDVYEAIVNYSSEDATIDYAIYGGNNACRRTLYGKVNINSPVWSNKTKGYTATVYGAGCGVNTWSQYTEVNLNNGASVYEVYGGGEDGQVLNSASVAKWKETQTNLFTTLSKGYTDNGLADGTPANSNRLHTVDNTRPKYYNTNVHINNGATVGGYCYGGGLGHGNIKHSGNVYGTTYIDLLGGKVLKDLYAAGTTGSVKDSLGVKGDFVASATAYIEGGSARNVYGGGWKGSVGHHDGDIDADYYNKTTGELIDIPGETHVVIGLVKDKLETAPEGDSHYHLYHGIPYIERNAYGGGEGGAVWGTTNITLNNGYIGYVYNKNGTDNANTANINERYEEKIEDDTYKDEDGHFQENKRLDDAGCIFGGGYIDNSSVDFTHVTMYGGHVRNALFGGGEIAAIGRGDITETEVDGKAVRSLHRIYRPGRTEIEMYDGYVHRNVFGGGRGYNNLGDHGKLFSDGYVFGQTEVHIHGGEIGTEKELIAGNGNVFGGGDIGYVYSAYEYTDAQGHKLPRKGVKSGVRYDGDGMYQGYYYEHVWDNTSSTEDNFIHYNGTERKLTEDCKVLIAPHCKVTATGGISLTIKYTKGQVVSAHDLIYINNHPELGLSGKIDTFGKVTADGGISFIRNYAKGEYVQTSALNAFGNKEDPKWNDLEANTNDDGIIIHNAVFAGGNTSSKGSDDESTYANSVSVYGNATASIHDVYHRDLITIGTGHIGGLYGDGNLTLVDGYRGLNITNYGTDYNYLYDEQNMSELTIAQYNGLLDREKDYYELRYKCILTCTDDDGTVYHPKDDNHSSASTLTADDILTLFAKQDGMFTTDTNGNRIPNPTYWEQNGVCSIYAGRILNTLQRADFCGVFGSRLVMQGAQDRVPEVVDYTKYTINRVREVSLNKKLSVIPADASNEKRKMHGNYFGIYSVVNYLGALTSDFDFGDQGTDTDEHDAAGKYTDNSDNDQPYKGDIGTGDVRTSDNINTGTYGPQYTGQTFYGWKRFHKNDRDRNNGNSHNKVALASGVYLELTTEESTGKDLYEKVWGPITGVVELDLINVQQGMGGGFVYAKNIHGKRTKTYLTNTTLTALNAGAVTRWDYTYAEPSTTSNAADPNQREWQTSGNFVHSTQTIIDDCYNVSSKYMGSDRVPAHYWYIKGSVYVYDQYISAYTGATNAYSEMVDIPLTITAASHGSMKLLNVQPNRYAYYNTNGSKLEGEQKLVINDVEYNLNTPISYWDWYKLTAAEQKLFVPKTYVSIAKYKYKKDAADEFPAEQVLLPDDYTAIVNNAHQEPKYDENDMLSYEAQLWDVENERYVPVESIIRLSNNLSHDTGYILTYKVNNPTEWNTWYTEYYDTSNTSAVREKKQSGLNPEYDSNHSQKGPNEGPTYHLKSGTGELLGQRRYKVSDIISSDVFTTYQAISPSYIPEDQATFVRAFVATAQTEIQRNGQTTHLYKGSTLSETEASGVSNVVEALVCTKTIRLNSTDNIYINSVMTEAERTGHLSNVNSEISTLVGEINTVLTANGITPIATSISDISSLTVAQLNTITALQKKELSDLLTRKKDITNNIVPAYYCTVAGLYGGDYYASGINYRGLEAWSSMSEEDRAKFDFNYDALDLLIDKNFAGTEGEKYQYDSAAGTLTAAQANPAGYSLEKPVDYTATYNGDDINLSSYNIAEIKVKRGNDEDYSTSTTKITSGDELSRTVYESLPNDQRHYTPLTVSSSDVANGKTCTFYVVNTPLMIGSTPYTIGNVISKDDYDGLYSTESTFNHQGKVTVLEYTIPGTYYFCREAYTPPTGSDTSVTGEVGSVITSGVYDGLTNLQKGFTIHGIAPTETSTLYVSRFSDIDDLSTEKIITVIYEYDYEESDVSGLHITPVTERHVLNIHIQFKTGAPIVEDISAPPIVLPGDILSLVPPNVIEGASPIQGGGWELYSTENDADNHNGVDYIPDIDPLYWYQNGYWLRYYALSYVGGKTYSNKVQVSVANYHDLKKVMEDKAHHYYIDIPDLNRLRDPKVYINDGTDGMNQLKNLFDLSLLTTTPTGNLAGHALLNSQIRKCDNLEFIMRTNVSHTGEWTPIGDATNCFEGKLHGDGHYISGLDHSLFANLCGSVYNLGVTGSFTSAGVADTGSGFVENCWINTTGTPDGSVYAVFGNPIAGENVKQIVNSYYQDGKNYKTEDATHGLATAKPDKAFYNGEVAYDLNGFYLFKRYWDQNNASGTGYTPYKYYSGETDPTTNQLVPKTEYYGSDITYCSTGHNGETYVESRYADGDFRYAAGEIPETNDERLYIDTDDGGRTKFYPIWPDDYLFFGQMLTYGWNESSPHEEVPSPIVKSSGRLLDTYQNNRVYRAPAYYRSKDMSAVHFNPWANLAAYSAPKTITDTNLKPAYPNMTAVDFAGHNDVGGSDAYKLGWNSSLFYQPLLDDDGLIGVANRGETPNLLVYAPAETVESGYANMKTYNVLNAYFIGTETERTEPLLSGYNESSDKYNDGKSYGRVAIASTTTIHGHLVQSDLKTTTDHLLVDMQDFNCPIAYDMGDGYRMWYQRTPDKFVDRTKGWEGVSLPFTTEIVTTQDKGEITHFYQGSIAGHEYWLREYAGNVKQKKDADNNIVAGVYTADFNPLAAGTNRKDYTNTFLWDYYYSKDSYKDYNTDEYQKAYYSKDYLKELYPVSDYPYSQAGMPYIIGFPGSSYYEFDMSDGGWTPVNRYQSQTIASKGKQTVTFVSVEGAPIGVSDDETGVTESGFTFKPTYLNNPNTEGENVYLLDNDGDSFDKTAASAVAITAFRPYFIGAPSSTRAVEQIIFGQSDDNIGVEEHGDPTRKDATGTLLIYAKKGQIVVKSSLSYTTDVRVVTPAGITVAAFAVEPGQTVEVQADFSGMYIVHTLDGRYTKKVSVRK
jgi:hypothetical protein